MNDHLLTPREARTRLRINRDAFRALVADGKVPVIRRPGSDAATPHWRIRSSDLDAYIESLKAVAPRSEEPR